MGLRRHQPNRRYIIAVSSPLGTTLKYFRWHRNHVWAWTRDISQAATFCTAEQANKIRQECVIKEPTQIQSLQ